MGSNGRQARIAALGSTLLAAQACCVCAATLVATPDGPRPLGALRVGDLVLSVAVESGELVVARVVAVRTAMRECVRLEHAGGELVCTPDHPIYCPETGAYEPASRWVEGLRHTVLLLPAGAQGAVAVPITGVEAFAGVREVVDISVDAPMHNFVAAGLLVHNKSYSYGIYGYFEGPAHTLAPDELVRAFGIRACIDGEDPSADDSYLTVRIDSFDLPPSSMGDMWFAVYLRGRPPGAEDTFIDDASGADPYLQLESMADMCLSPLEIVFERLDGLPDGEIGFTWEVSGRSAPLRGKDDGTITMEITELDEG